MHIRSSRLTARQAVLDNMLAMTARRHTKVAEDNSHIMLSLGRCIDVDSSAKVAGFFGWKLG